MVLCKLRNPWAGFFTAGWYAILEEYNINRGDIGLVDKLHFELQRLKEETHLKQMPPRIDVIFLFTL